MDIKIDNVNIKNKIPLISPRTLKKTLSLDEEGFQIISGFRNDIIRILERKDKRFLVIVGPCSIHDARSALEYAHRIQELRMRYIDTLYIVMRVYFEKPRTSLGWRGLIVDPRLDGSYKLDEGLHEARRILLEINKIGLPAGTEVLDPIIPQYIADLISWAAIGARTTESQIHRELSSGLSMPVGFKNSTDGDFSKAVNAVYSAMQSHRFIGINQEGETCIFETRGNQTGHIILRGGSEGPNYFAKNIRRAEELFSGIGRKPSIIVDCSHANSGKDYTLQKDVCFSSLKLREEGVLSLHGIMLESHLVPGRQEIPKDVGNLVYGQSITDSCIGWEETQTILGEMADRLSSVQK